MLLLASAMEGICHMERVTLAIGRTGPVSIAAITETESRQRTGSENSLLFLHSLRQHRRQGGLTKEFAHWRMHNENVRRVITNALTLQNGRGTMRWVVARLDRGPRRRTGHSQAPLSPGPDPAPSP